MLRTRRMGFVPHVGRVPLCTFLPLRALSSSVLSEMGQTGWREGPVAQMGHEARPTFPAGVLSRVFLSSLLASPKGAGPWPVPGATVPVTAAVG